MRVSLIPQTRMPDLGVEGLAISREIGRGAHSIVYLARYRNQDVAVKVCSAADRYEHDGATVRFRREGAALSRLSHPALARVLCMGADPTGRSYMMLEHVSGESLSDRILRSRLSETETISLVRELAGALTEVHRRGLIHRDVKPDNIMLDKSGAPKLIDFGLALESGSAQDAQSVVGTLAYSPPEQTGMSRRSIDARSDLYALGVVTFECLTGRRPFASEDAGRLIQMHAIDVPQGVRALRPELSPAIERIVAKLLAKDPDDRYSSARSLVWDLDHVDTLGDEPAAFGTYQAEDGKGGGGRLLGRSQELLALSRVASEARAGKGALVSLRGEPGTGVTHTARTWLKREQNSQDVVCLWAAGGSESGTPLGALRDALNEYARGADREVLGPLLRDAAGDYAACLSTQFPALGPFFGESRLGTGVTVSQDVGYEAVCSLLSRVARSVGLLLLVVDDAHRVDSATRCVLERLSPRLSELPIVVVCTSVPKPGQAGTLADSAELTLELGPLPAEAVAALAADFLGSESVDPELTRQLHARSGGSPRGVLDLLRLLLARGLLSASWGHWALDSTQLHAMPLPDSVEKLALDRLSTLASPARAVLRLAAVVGRRFEPATLEAIGELAPEVTEQALREAVSAHLIEGPAASVGTAPSYAFLHERVQSCLASELEPGLCMELHQQLAAYREKQPDFPGKVFDVARHWGLGVDASHATQALTALTSAAHAALEGLAFIEADEWFRKVLEVAAANGLVCDYRIYRGLAQASMNSGKVPEAMAQLTQAIARCPAGADLATMHLQMAEMIVWESCGTKVMRQHLSAGWEALGRGMPQGATVSLLGRTLWWLVSAGLASLFGWGFGSKANDTAYRAQYKLGEQTGAYAFMTHQFALLLYSTARNMFVSHRIGRSRELIWARAARAHTLAALGFSRKSVDSVAQSAYDLADELGDAAGRARVAMLHASAMLYMGDVARGESSCIEVLRRHGRVLDVSDLMMLVRDICYILTKRGDVARAKEHLTYTELLLS